MWAALTGLLALLFLPEAASAAPVPPFPGLAATPRAEAGTPPAPPTGDGFLGWAFSSSETVGSVGLFRPSIGHPGGPRRARADRRGTAPRRGGADLRRRPDPGRAREARATAAGRCSCHRGAARRRRRRGGGQRGHHLLARHPRRDSACRARRGPRGLLGQPGGIDRESFEPVDWGLAGGDGSIVRPTGEPRRRDGPPGTPGLRPDAAGDLRACSSSCFWASPRRRSVATSWGSSLSPGSRPRLGQ